jgi:hypothetical protein
MLRFNVNRSWGFVLTLCLFTTCLFLYTAQSPTVASAGGSGSFTEATGDPVPPPSLGDPDVPMGPGDGKIGKGSVVRNGSNQVVLQHGASPAVGGAVPTSVVMSRMQLFLLGLRILFLRF